MASFEDPRKSTRDTEVRTAKPDDRKGQAKGETKKPAPAQVVIRDWAAI